MPPEGTLQLPPSPVSRPRCCLVRKSSLTLVTPWTIAHQAPLSMAFPGQKYWSGLPSPSPGDHPGPGIEHCSPACQEDSLH